MMNRTVAILFASIATLAAVADTNVVADAEKCRQITPVNVVTMTPPGAITAMSVTSGATKAETDQRTSTANAVSALQKGSASVVQGVGIAQSDRESHVVDCGRHESLLNCGWWVALGTLVVLVILTLRMMFGKRFAECRWSVASMAMLVSLVGLITLCSFMWVERVVCDCEQKREFFRSECMGDRLSKSEAVLKAYDQLSSELSRWFAMFAVLGTFFGFVLPVGSYFLQIRELNRKGKEIDDRIDERVKSYTEQVLNTKQEFEKDIEDTQQKLWKALADRSYMSLISTLYACKDSKWKFTKPACLDIIVDLLQSLNWLSRLADRKCVTQYFKKLASELREFKKATDPDPEWKCTNRTKDSDVRFDLGWCAESCKDDYELIQGVLHTFGIKVLDRS